MKKIMVTALLLAALLLSASALAGNEAALWQNEQTGLVSAQKELGFGSRDVRIAIIDGMADANCSELAGRVVYVYDYFTGEECVKKSHSSCDHGDISPHATAAASLAAGKTMGAAPNASVMLLRAINPDTGNETSVSVAACVYKAVENDADVINLSLGRVGLRYDDIYMLEALEYAYDSGAFISVSAANAGAETLYMPASAAYVMTVGATGSDKKAAGFSTLGWNVDISAPGKEVTVFNGSEYITANGTSYSAAIVSGAAALLKSGDPSLKGADIADILLQTADGEGVASDADKKALGGGRLDIAAAAELVAARRKTQSEAPVALGLAGNEQLFTCYGDTKELNYTVKAPLASDTLEFEFCKDSGEVICSTGGIKWEDIGEGLRFADFVVFYDGKGKGRVQLYYDYTGNLGSVAINGGTVRIKLTRNGVAYYAGQRIDITQNAGSAQLDRPVIDEGDKSDITLSFKLHKALGQRINPYGYAHPTGFKLTAYCSGDSTETTLWSRENVTDKALFDEGDNVLMFTAGQLKAGTYSLYLKRMVKEEQTVIDSEYLCALYVTDKPYVEATASEGGRLETSALTGGGAYIFTPVADEGWAFVKLTANGKEVKLKNGSYRLNGPSSDTLVYAQFARLNTLNTKKAEAADEEK